MIEHRIHKNAEPHKSTVCAPKSGLHVDIVIRPSAQKTVGFYCSSVFGTRSTANLFFRLRSLIFNVFTYHFPFHIPHLLPPIVRRPPSIVFLTSSIFHHPPLESKTRTYHTQDGMVRGGAAHGGAAGRSGVGQDGTPTSRFAGDNRPHCSPEPPEHRRQLS